MKKVMTLTATLLLCTPLVMSCSSTQNMIPSSITGMPQGQENDSYKVVAAGGVIGSVVPKDAENSEYRYAFNIELKKALSVNSVRIEKLNADGSRTLIIDDSTNKTKTGNFQNQTPAGARSYLNGNTLGHVTWIGHSAQYNMTESQAPWLYQQGTTKSTYLITITDLEGNTTTITQKTSIPSHIKKTYLNLLN